MINKYANKTNQISLPDNISPSDAVINRILDYSKAIEVKKMKREKVLINLN